MRNSKSGYTQASLRIIFSLLLFAGGGSTGMADEAEEHGRELIGWGWQQRPHGQTLASDVLGQFVGGDPRRPNFGGYGPYGGPTAHGFFFFAFNAGRYQMAGSPAAHVDQECGKLAVPDYWNHRVLLFDLRADGSVASHVASGLLGQERFDLMEIGHGPSRLQFPSACSFDPTGKRLFATKGDLVWDSTRDDVQLGQECGPRVKCLLLPA
jgi:hypothetical protein